MDVPALVVNFGVLVATAAAAAVAWWQAIEAGRRGDAAKKAKDGAVSAQAAAADALREANAIAQEAKQLVQDNLELERRREARLAEHRDVRWDGAWNTQIEAEDSPTYTLTNVGTTAACSVTLVLNLPQGRQHFTLGDIPPGGRADARIENTGMRGRIASAAMAYQYVDIWVHWTSPLGHPDDNEWSQVP